MAKWFTREKEGESKPPSSDDQSALLDAFAAKMNETLETAIKPLRETVTNLQSDWESIKNEAEKSTPEHKEELTDEQKRQQADRANFLFNMQTRAMLVENNLLNSLSADWSHLKPRLTEMFSKTAPEIKASPAYEQMCQNAVRQLVGEEALKGGLRRTSEGRFFLEDAHAKTGGEDSPLNDFPVWQSDDRTETASDTLTKLGINPEEFAKDLKSGRLQ